jgi:hypothetical protein
MVRTSPTASPFSLVTTFKIFFKEEISLIGIFEAPWSRFLYVFLGGGGEVHSRSRFEPGTYPLANRRTQLRHNPLTGSYWNCLRCYIFSALWASPSGPWNTWQLLKGKLWPGPANFNHTCSNCKKNCQEFELSVCFHLTECTEIRYDK